MTQLINEWSERTQKQAKKKNWSWLALDGIHHMSGDCDIVSAISTTRLPIAHHITLGASQTIEKN